MVWVRLDDQFATDPKVLEAGPLGIAMQVAALCYCNRHLTDGKIPRPAAAALLSFEGLGMRMWQGEIVGGGEDASWELVVEDLVSAEMWHEPGHDCDECPDITAGYYLHGYLDYQPSKADVEAGRDKKREAGRKGGKASAKARAQAGASASAQPPAQADAQAESKPVPGPVPEPQYLPPLPPALRGEKILPFPSSSTPRSNGTNPRAVKARQKQTDAAVTFALVLREQGFNRSEAVAAIEASRFTDPELRQLAIDTFDQSLGGAS